MESWIEESIDNIDCALFTGDMFLNMENIKILREAMVRWEKELKSNVEMLDEKNQKERETK